jgi:micrococcal nuclease
MRRGLTALIALTVLVATGSLAQTPQFSAQVRRITDGDTFRMYDLEPAIRIWGLDAPETDEPGGSEATQTLTRLIAGQTLTCQIKDVDRYSRIVGQCFLPNGRDIAAEMIGLGVATEYCRYSGGHYGTCN